MSNPGQHRSVPNNKNILYLSSVCFELWKCPGWYFYRSDINPGFCLKHAMEVPCLDELLQAPQCELSKQNLKSITFVSHKTATVALRSSFWTFFPIVFHIFLIFSKQSKTIIRQGGYNDIFFVLPQVELISFHYYYTCKWTFRLFGFRLSGLYKVRKKDTSDKRTFKLETNLISLNSYEITTCIMRDCFCFWTSSSKDFKRAISSSLAVNWKRKLSTF